MSSQQARCRIPFDERATAVYECILICDADPRFSAARAVQRLIVGLCEDTRNLDPWRRGLHATSGFTAN